MYQHLPHLSPSLFFLLGAGYMVVPTSIRFKPLSPHHPDPYQWHSCVLRGTCSRVTTVLIVVKIEQEGGNI